MARYTGFEASVPLYWASSAEVKTRSPGGSVGPVESEDIKPIGAAISVFDAVVSDECF